MPVFRQQASATFRAASQRALAAVVTGLIALSGGTGIAAAHEHADRGAAHGRNRGGNSTAVVINTADNSLMFKLTFAILTVSGNVVDNQNVADAYASCDHCETVAISIQTLLVESAASIVAPIDEASARNQNCDQCDTVAIAYQFVVAAGTKLEFTPEGRRQIAYVRRELERLRGEARRGMTGAQILVAVAALMKRYASALNTDLVPVSQNGAGKHRAATSSDPPAAGVAPPTGRPPAAPDPATNLAASGVSTTASSTSAADPGSAASPVSTTTSTGTSGGATSTTATTPTDTTPTSTTPTSTTTTSTTTTSTTPAATPTSGVTTTPAATTTPAGTTTTPPSPSTP